MTTLTLTSWTIRRSGSGLSVKGKDPAGTTRTVTGIQQIFPASAARALPHGAGRTKEDGVVTVLLGACS